MNIDLNSYYTDYIKIKQDDLFEFVLVRVENNTPLCVSIENENIEVIQLLLQQKKNNVNIEYKYVEKYMKEIKKDWYIDWYRKTPLFIAVEK